MESTGPRSLLKSALSRSNGCIEIITADGSKLALSVCNPPLLPKTKVDGSFSLLLLCGTKMEGQAHPPHPWQLPHLCEHQRFL
jgi:hypothetical protein